MNVNVRKIKSNLRDNVRTLVFPSLIQLVKFISRNFDAHAPSVNNFTPISLILNRKKNCIIPKIKKLKI